MDTECLRAAERIIRGLRLAYGVELPITAATDMAGIIAATLTGKSTSTVQRVKAMIQP